MAKEDHLVWGSKEVTIEVYFILKLSLVYLLMNQSNVIVILVLLTFYVILYVGSLFDPYYGSVN